MKLSLITAVSQNGVIGTGQGGLPWHLPRDSAHFRSYTQGKWMLLGRKTFLEMRGWFTDQTPLVLTANQQFTVPNGFTVASVPDAISLAKGAGAEELVVSGGAAIYEASLPYVEEMHITRVGAIVRGSVFFPRFDDSDWDLVKTEKWPSDGENAYEMTLQTFSRHV